MHIKLQSARDINSEQGTCLYISVISVMKFIIDHSELTGKQLRATPSSEETRKDSSHCFYNIVNPSNKIQCDECKRDISKNTKILAEENDFCVSCFANIDEFPDQYHVINKLDYPIFDQEWTADEELMLFEGLEKHGFGNWAEIAEFIGTNKRREDVQQHYMTYFLQTPGFMPTAAIITKRDSSGKLIRSGIEVPIKKYQRPVSRIFSSHSIQSFQRGSLTVNQMVAGSKTGNNPAEIVGYMPKRGDFEVQFDNDAELLLAQMEFNDDDSEQEKHMKFRLIEIYNHKLNERIRRKQFVISRKLLDLKEQQRLEKTRSKEEKEIYNMMKVFARFSTPEEHDQLVQGIIKEKQIRARLQELKEIKKKGFRTIADLNQELDCRKKRQEKVKKRQDPIFLTPERIRASIPDFRLKKSKRQSTVERGQSRPSFPSSEEEQICRRFGMTHTQLLIIKNNLIRESIKQGIIDLQPVSKSFKAKRAAIERIMDFLVQKDELLGNARQGKGSMMQEKEEDPFDDIY